MSKLVADVTGRGPAVVLLHGQPGSALDWAAVVDLLRPDFTVIVPDRPGYGRTGGRAAGFRGNAAAVVELLDRLQWPQAVVAGHSWAGGVALALAQSHPHRVAGLVLVGSVGPADPPGVMDKILAIPPVGRVLASLAIGGARRALAHPAVRALVDRRVTVPTSDQLARAWRAQGLGRSFAIEQQALVSELASLAPGLAGVAVPATVVFGTADHIVSPATARRLAAGLPDGRLVAVEGAGHLLPYDHPGVVAAAVADVARRAGVGVPPPAVTG
ncbi:MAG TPA: alpha/beta hydrolase [Acidimicrobiales bacterium]|nr:alpha/beta hydrolase [Acidimicrobiales bacterium]